jgi:hypothetical protein
MVDVCPICGDFDIGDWCDRCGVPTKQVNTSRNRRPEDDYASQQYEEYINGLLKKQEEQSNEQSDNT